MYCNDDDDNDVCRCCTYVNITKRSSYFFRPITSHQDLSHVNIVISYHKEGFYLPWSGTEHYVNSPFYWRLVSSIVRCFWCIKKTHIKKEWWQILIHQKMMLSNLKTKQLQILSTMVSRTEFWITLTIWTASIKTPTDYWSFTLDHQRQALVLSSALCRRHHFWQKALTHMLEELKGNAHRDVIQFKMLLLAIMTLTDYMLLPLIWFSRTAPKPEME